MSPKYFVAALPLYAMSFGALANTPAPVALEHQAISAFLETEGPLTRTHNEFVVEILKQSHDGNHIMGSLTETVSAASHAAPTSHFFFAHRQGDGWELGIEGSEDFSAALDRMPLDTIGESERMALQQGVAAEPEHWRAAGHAVKIGLPWRAGTAWTMTSGAHGFSGSSRPYNSLDFYSRQDGNNVRAAANGTVYTSCARNGSALVTIVHDNGYRTSYYHMVRLEPLDNGTRVSEGTRLGSVGNGLPCGGSSSGAHVHFSLLDGQNRPMSVNNVVLGGWTFRTSMFPYQGSAQRANKTVYRGNPIYNFGSADPGL
ncbi:MAG TPA: M23 family metallopeptidase [Dyella sp.]|uniref:M23 family metallopeptidase n=1 Tax=Dyella sp. TaxID=1869338 RepID=UPI002F928D16